MLILLQIARGLRDNKTVTVLKLSRNEFDKKCSLALVEAIAANRTLQSLSVAQCSFSKVYLNPRRKFEIRLIYAQHLLLDCSSGTDADASA